jgi:hypothetical protein
MTDTINDGGPAFPLYCGPGDTGNTGGMTLRDYFAAAALQGITARTHINSDMRGWAELAYKHADAMLAERNKNND